MTSSLAVKAAEKAARAASHIDRANESAARAREAADSACLDIKEQNMRVHTIYDEIKAERDYQREKWGDRADDTLNTPWMWAAYIGQYATKWMRGTFLPLKTDVTDAFRECMVKVASLAVAAIESIDRQRMSNEKTFYEEN